MHLALFKSYILLFNIYEGACLNNYFYMSRE